MSVGKLSLGSRGSGPGTGRDRLVIAGGTNAPISRSLPARGDAVRSMPVIVAA